MPHPVPPCRPRQTSQHIPQGSCARAQITLAAGRFGHAGWQATLRADSRQKRLVRATIDLLKFQQSVDGSTLASSVCVTVCAGGFGSSTAGHPSPCHLRPPVIKQHGTSPSRHAWRTSTLATSSSYCRHIFYSQRRLERLKGSAPKLGSVANGCETQTVETHEKPVVVSSSYSVLWHGLPVTTHCFMSPVSESFRHMSNATSHSPD